MCVLLAILIGFAFSVVAGHLLTALVIDAAWKRLLAPTESSKLRGDQWFTKAVGVLERLLFTAAWLLKKPEFIAVWLAFKVAGQWQAWSKETEVCGRKIPARPIYTIFLIGNALSLLYGVTGALLIEWLRQEKWLLAVSVPLALIAGSLILLRWAIWRYDPKSDKS